jgi:hypothetical protein
VTRFVSDEELRLAQRFGWAARRAGSDYLFVRVLSDGRRLYLLEWRVGGVQVSVGWGNGFFDDTWIFDVEQADDGWRAALGWDGEGEPDGWYRHPQSGRRRLTEIPRRSSCGRDERRRARRVGRPHDEGESETAMTTPECKHELACRKCGESIGAISLAAAAAEEMATALDAVNEELAAQLVTTVRVERYGGPHEGVTIWLRGANVGTLTVGDGEGEALRRLLLSEGIVAKARELVRLWKLQDGFNASVVDAIVSEVDLTDSTVEAERRSEAAAS